MRQRAVAGVMPAALFLVWLVIGCGSSAAPAASPKPAGTQSCAGVAGAHHAWVVVQHLDAKVTRKCVGFQADTVPGLDLMRDSGIEYKTQLFSFGSAVCQVDGEPAQFDQCLPQNAPYWAMFVDDGSGWKAPNVGIADVKIGDKNALGWRYTQPSASPAPPPEPPKG